MECSLLSGACDMLAVSCCSFALVEIVSFPRLLRCKVNFFNMLKQSEPATRYLT